MRNISTAKYHGIIWKLVTEKEPCDPIGGTAKRKADLEVKNGRFVIQDNVDFYEWSKQESSAIKYVYLSTEEYEMSANFLKALCKNLDSVNGTVKLHAVFSLKPNWIWIRDTSCFCSNCFDHNFGKDSCCKGWHECELKTIVPRKTKNVKNVSSVSNAASTRSVVEEGQSSSNGTLVPLLSQLLEIMWGLYVTGKPILVW